MLNWKSIWEFKPFLWRNRLKIQLVKNANKFGHFYPLFILECLRGSFSMISVKANFIFSSLILCSVRLHYTCVDHFRRLEQNNYEGKTPWVRIMQKRKKRGRLKRDGNGCKLSIFYFHKYALKCVADVMSIYTWEIVVEQERKNSRWILRHK